MRALEQKQPSARELKSVLWDHVTNAKALDCLSEQGVEIDDSALENAIRRRKQGVADWELRKQRPLLTW